jgi:hypothetical protein
MTLVLLLEQRGAFALEQMPVLQCIGESELRSKNAGAPKLALM